MKAWMGASPDWAWRRLPHAVSGTAANGSQHGSLQRDSVLLAVRAASCRAHQCQAWPSSTPCFRPSRLYAALGRHGLAAATRQRLHQVSPATASLPPIHSFLCIGLGPSFLSLLFISSSPSLASALPSFAPLASLYNSPSFPACWHTSWPIRQSLQTCCLTHALLVLFHSLGDRIHSVITMKSFFAVATGLLATCSSVLAAPSNQGFINKYTLPANHSTELKEYIVTWWRNETVPEPIEKYMDALELNKDGDTILFESSPGVNPRVVVLKMCDDHARIFQSMAEINVVEEKAQVKSFVTERDGSPWGLQRISSAAGARGSPQGQDFTYSFDDSKLGAGVDIYIVDTGVRTSHAVFTGRATQGFTATGSFVDGDGHGTHVAGTAGGAKFGVAQGANIIEVKVLGDDGSGASSDTIRGMDWVIARHNKRKTEPGFVGSIMSMSWGLQGTANSVDEVIAGASEAGIHVSVAAGNDGQDACGSTPAHLGGANSNVVTVGSVNINNKISSFSNIGKCVDIYAPGEQILSSWSTGDNVINFLSGTSMACPHTTGVMAYLMTEDVAGLGQNPAALKAKLLQTARQGLISGNTGGSANLLLSNGVSGNVAKRLVKNYVVPDHSGLNGSPAARAAAAMANDVTIDKRFQLHSRDVQLRF